MSSKLPVILITGHPAHAGLIEALRARGAHRVVVIGDETFNQYLHEVQSNVVHAIERRGANWSAAFDRLAQAGTFHLSGHDLTSTAAAALANQVTRLVPDLIRVSEAFDRLHREGPVQAVVVHNEVAPILRAVLAAAERYGIPTLHLPHGLGLNRFAMEDFDDLIRASLVGAQGAFTRDFFLGNPANSADRITLIGRPEWDTYYDRPPLDREAACRTLGLDPTRPIVAFAGCWAHELTSFDLRSALAEHFRSFLHGVLRLGDPAPQVIIRPHPGHRDLGDFGPDWHQQIAHEVGVSLSVPDVSQDTFLAAADLVVSLDSNFSAVALLADRLPLSITWQQHGGTSVSSYAGLSGIATCAGDSDSIHTALKAGLYDADFRAQLAAGRQETLAYLNFGNDGQATERAVALIERLADCAPSVSLASEGGYYGRINRHLASMIPPTAMRILEVGCGAGYLGAWLKEQDPRREVIGLEAFPDAAAEARKHLDRVLEGDVETLALPFPEGYFDCILYGDVLEHLRDPGAVLAQHRRYLAPNGAILVCTPNVGHWSILVDLLRGKFTYTDEGLLDRTHLRFFTQQSFSELLAQAGLKVAEARTIEVPNPAAAQALRGAAQALGIDNPNLEAQSNAYQLLFRATHAVAVDRVTLPDARGFNFLVAESDPAHLTPVLESYLQAFQEGDEVALHVLVDPSIQAHVLSILERMEVDLEHIPDISLIDRPTPETLPGYLLAADLVLGSPQTVRLARDLGALALSAPSPEDLRTAAANLKGYQRELAPVVLDSSAQERWLVLASDAWQNTLQAYLDVVKPGDSTLLILATPLGTASALEAQVGQWLAERGHHPDSIPDVTLVEVQPGSEVALFRSATAWVANEPSEATIAAKALGLPIVSATSLAPRTPAGNTRYSLVVVTYNSMKTIEGCVESALRTLAPGDELWVVDNASVDGTAAWLKDRAARDPRMHVILNPRNLGFSAATNLGLRAASGDYLVMLNPDTEVTPGWLERMRAHFTDPEIGAVGPTSDYVAGLQKYQLYAPEVAPGTLSPQQLAMRLAYTKHPEVETKLLIGFCMMLSRHAMDQVGMLDEVLFLGNDDLDLSWRMRLQGFRLRVATDTFVRHIGQVSFKTEPAETTKRLVQESTDALARKLVAHYGVGRVPSSSELWDIGWFTPSPGILDGEGAGYAASIVVLTFNQLDVTQLCLDSLYRHTRNFELIVVDNASTDGTPEFLRAFAAAHDNVQVILNAQNRGFAGGCNQGIAASRGRDVVLLNNDTVVSEGWLEGLLSVSRLPDVGLVGPRTNCIVGPQQVNEVDYDQHTLEGFEAFANTWRQTHTPEATQAHRVIGFCMLIRREVIERIGGLDTSFGRGNFEDDDYCIRAQLAGFRIAFAEHVFIHHFGSVTFKGQKIDYRELLLENWGNFRKKWLLPEMSDVSHGYRFADALCLPFDPALHTEPVYSPQGPAAQLPDQRGYNIALVDPDPDRLKAIVSMYLQAFSEHDDVVLHVLAGPDAERAHGEILDAIALGGLDPDRIPEVSLLDAPATPLELPAHLRGVDLVLGAPRVVQGARDMGLPAFDAPSVEALREAHASFKALDWSVGPLAANVHARERWLLTFGPEWQAGLETFLAATDRDLALLVRVKAGEAESAFETLQQWLLEAGHDPESIPDVILLDQEVPSEVAIFRMATAWVDDGDAVRRAIAAAVGLMRIAPLERAAATLSREV